MTSPDEGRLDDLRSVDTADVFKSGRRAARLTRTPDGVEFRYLDEWIAAQLPAVATTLPVTAEPMTRPGGALPSYFAGLLPEGRRLGALRRAVKTSADDELTLLLAVGADAVGDVQVVPAGATAAEVPPRIAVDLVDQVSFAELLAELGIRAQRMALPGVQDKTSAAVINLPVTRAGERYILKLNPPGEYPHLVENEAFFLGAARLSGLAVPHHRVVTDRDGAPGLLVRRFDRVTDDGDMRALAVEDGCQAAGRPPADKYLLSSEQTFAVLAATCVAPIVAGRELIRQLAFAYLIGNGDAHAKNFSVLQDLTGERRISPVYDVPCTHVYGDTTMALSIAGRIGSEFRLGDFVQLGETLGVPPRATIGALADLARRADRWLPTLPELPFARTKIVKLRRVITHRRDQLTGTSS